MIERTEIEKWRYQTQKQTKSHAIHQVKIEQY